MNREVRLKARNAAFRCGDQEAYNPARANLRRGISHAKFSYKQWIEKHFNSSDPRRMWQDIQTIMNIKPPSTVPPTSSASLPDKLNYFYACFDQGNEEAILKADLPPPSHTLHLRCLLHPEQGECTEGPDGIPGPMLRTCAEQLAGVFTDIFNLSMAQTVVLTNFKTASIVPVPKLSTATALNDFHPVALTPNIAKRFKTLVLSHLKSCLPATLVPHQFAYRHNSAYAVD
eukprot:superscaffoldBa00001673_g11568